jgi:hypothetical protein
LTAGAEPGLSRSTSHPGASPSQRAARQLPFRSGAMRIARVSRARVSCRDAKRGGRIHDPYAALVRPEMFLRALGRS